MATVGVFFILLPLILLLFRTILWSRSKTYRTSVSIVDEYSDSSDGTINSDLDRVKLYRIALMMSTALKQLYFNIAYIANVRFALNNYHSTSISVPGKPKFLVFRKRFFIFFAQSSEHYKNKWPVQKEYKASGDGWPINGTQF